MQDGLAGMLGPGELRRLEECAREPIHTPGRIQSHGMLLGVATGSGRISVASENAGAWLGRDVAELRSPGIRFALESATHVDPVAVELEGDEFDAIVHRGDELTLIELEPRIASLEYARTSVVAALQRIAAVDDPDELRTLAAEQIRAITGFDRVMVYRFHDDEHGEIVAESRAADMEPYLGLHFPASDIPPQARRLYVTKLSRAIVSTSDPGSPLLALDETVTASLDLGAAELRAVSPYHLQFMRNMGQESTVSLSMVRDGRLHGMITCAHRTVRRLPVLLRRALEVYATHLSLQLSSAESIGRLTRALHVRDRRSALLAPLFASEDVMSALLDGPATVLDLVEADGVIVRIGDEVRVAGEVPATDPAIIMDAVAADPETTDSLVRDRPDLAPLLPGFAGLVAVPLAAHGALVFLRLETTRVVDWLGDQSTANRPDDLSPRVSFSAWRESVDGVSRPWGPAAAEIEDLGRELADALDRRAESALAALALRDPLTGLRNRRYLVERLAKPGPARELVFVDLDLFKEVNDTHGHDAGDAVLIEVARRLVSSARDGDAVVRLGGDEFVVLCTGLDHERAVGVAERIVAAIARPIAVPGAEITITASCGVVEVDAAASGAQLLERADAAMYRAKRAGRNRVSD
ncbi:MAG TPA: diguanylate cyclase [Pseudolysinimonas sp.]|nr:diguanylate cyclase [Pseudolysinimonas sp.]